MLVVNTFLLPYKVVSCLRLYKNVRRTIDLDIQMRFPKTDVTVNSNTSSLLTASSKRIPVMVSIFLLCYPLAMTLSICLRPITDFNNYDYHPINVPLQFQKSHAKLKLIFFLFLINSCIIVITLHITCALETAKEFSRKFQFDKVLQ